MKKIGVFIQARISSLRLPGKVLMKLAGKEVLFHIVERCLLGGFDKSNIFILTSNEKSDDLIEEFCTNFSLKCYRGSLNDVLERFYRCSEEYGIEYIFRVTGDNPLTDININQLKLLQKLNKEYIYLNKRGTLGLGVEIFSKAMLAWAYDRSTILLDRENVTSFIRKSFSDYEINEYKTGHRLTLDEKNDFDLLSVIFNKFYKNGELINLEDVLEFLDKNPDIANINKFVEQKKITN